MQCLRVPEDLRRESEEPIETSERLLAWLELFALASTAAPLLAPPPRTDG